MWPKIFTVFAKESIDNVRDRRSLLVALVYPLMGPILLGLIISVVSGIIKGAEDKHVEIPVIGEEHAPGLIAYFEAREAIIVPAPDDPETAVRRGLLQSVLVIEEDYPDDFDAERTAAVRVIVDSSRLPGLIALGRILEIVGTYAREISHERLEGRGLDPGIAEPIRIETVNVATGANITDLFLMMVPPFIIFTIFMGGVYLALDSTSGERERGTLEPLLINPVERWALMMGKFLASLLFTVVAVVVQLLAFKLIFNWVGSADSGLAGAMSLPVMFVIFVTALPLMMLAVGVQTIIATITYSFKEAQTYLGLLPLVPAIPGLALVFVPLHPQPWMMTIPAFAQTLLFGQCLRGDAPSLLNLMVAFAVAAALAAALCAFAARLYEREELIFGN